MIIRRYKPGEEEQLWQLYHDTTHVVNGKDYTPEQFERWAPSQVEHAIEAAEMKIPSLRELHADLQQLCEEFGGVRYSAAEHFLAAATEPIELEGVYLGDFEIRLDLQRLGDARSLHNAYTIVALDPHPAGSNDAVTHPHVSDEHLCAGDAGAAIGAALTGGRICDFFMLVGSVLTTYNPDSPYVSLSEWSGRPCYDCGYTMADAEDYFCNGCEESFCSECTMPCMRCEETYCRGCLTQCRVCGDSFCHGCMTTCPECGEPICQNCVDDEACECLEEKETEEKQEPVAR